jgi:hypothetical protein
LGQLPTIPVASNYRELTLNRTYACDGDFIIDGAAESMASKMSDDNKRLALSVMLAVF